MRRLLLITLFTGFFSVFAQAQSTRNAAPSETGSPILRFFPNPAVSAVTFDFQKAYEKGFSIQIFSFLGKMVYEAKNIAARTTINLSDFSRGMYIYQLRDEAGRMVESSKFQVAK